MTLKNVEKLAQLDEMAVALRMAVFVLEKVVKACEERGSFASAPAVVALEEARVALGRCTSERATVWRRMQEEGVDFE